jgi:hypothetical protein
MVTCERCGWSFDSIRMSHEGSCPRCRLRDGVKSPLVDRGAKAAQPSFLDLVTEASEKVRREREGVPRTGQNPGWKGDQRYSAPKGDPQSPSP